MNRGSGRRPNHSFPRDAIAVFRRHVKARDLTLEAMAADLELSTTTIYNFLNGNVRKETTFDQHVVRFCKYLEIEPQQLLAEVRLLDQHGLESAKYCMFIGDSLTLWYSRVGNGIAPIKDQNIDLIYDGRSEVRFPSHLERLVHKVRDEHGKGMHDFDNNSLLTVLSGETSAWKGKDEEFYCKLILGKSDYAALYALRRTEDGKRLLKDYIDKWSPDILFEAATGQGVGVNVVVVTADDCMMLGRRSREVAVRTGQLDVSCVEGFNIKQDVGADAEESRRRFEPTPIALRAIHEEYGITDDKVRSVSFLNLGFDLQYAQWNLIALAKTSLSSTQVRNRQRSVASQGIEYSDVYAVGCTNPKDVFTFLADDERPVWSCGLAAAFYAQVALHGVSAVEDALQDIKFRDPERFLWD
ncbi:MAG: helix-turn-helix domain-containing protein [Hyphomicrobiaceae bacterium]